MDELHAAKCEETEWHIIQIDERDYLIKFNYNNNIWKVILSDLIHLWFEELSLEMLIDRCMRLNPALDIEAFDTKNTITSLLTEIPKYLDSVSLKYINLSKVIEGGAFNFCIELKRGDPIQLWQEVTSKLCKSMAELMHRYNFLIKTVQDKDKEILEYKLEGAQLIRKNLETEVFKEDCFSKTSFCTHNGASDIKNIQNIMKLNKSFTSGSSSNDAEVTIKSENSNEHNKPDETVIDKSCLKSEQEDELIEQDKTFEEIQQFSKKVDIQDDTKRRKLL